MSGRIQIPVNEGKQRISVILPCAGMGSRLGLSGPKELHEVEPGFPLIRYSLDLLMHTPPDLAARTQVVVVIRPGKERVASVVQERLAATGMRVIPVAFDAKLREWPGSIHSARHHFSKVNLVLLPDSYLGLGGRHRSVFTEESKRISLLQRVETKLEAHALVFGVKRTQCDRDLRQLGALEVASDGTVLRFQDKPTNPDGFNAVWGCFAFRSGIADALHSMLMATVERRSTGPSYLESRCYPSGSFDVHEYFDLGTPERISAFLQHRRA